MPPVLRRIWICLGFTFTRLRVILRGFWAVTVSRKLWRVIFRFAGGEALDVDYIDYH